MRLLHLEIENFRGIKKCSIKFPTYTRLVCLIGAGDSTKSTLLKAIEWVLWPTWNLSVSDMDFFNSKTTSPIIIKGSFIELPASLLSEDKFGLYLRNSTVPIPQNDEPVEGEPECLTIQLTIDETLEPRWEVICNRKDPKQISYRDRQLISIGIVGSMCEKDMVWSRYSVLQKYANSKGILKEAFITAMREVVVRTDLSKLDEISKTISAVGMQYGVELPAEVKSKLLLQSGGLSSSVGLFDGGVPLNQRGLGSQRLLSMGLNINACTDGSILLIDEVENGLEPYRLRSLLNKFRVNHAESGQIIMTTHSSIVVAELSIKELMVIQSINGETFEYLLYSSDEEQNKVIQGQVRSNPEALLSKRIIVCEGKTEVGFVRSLDNHIDRKYHYRMACEGVTTAIGGGEQVFKCAILLSKCGYDVCVFMDSDVDKDDEKNDAKHGYGIDTYSWAPGNSIEEQIFHDVSEEIASQLLDIAIERKSEASIICKLKDFPLSFEEGKVKLGSMSTEKQRRIGTIAKNKSCEWYKMIGLGEKVGDVIFSNWESIPYDTILRQTVDKLIGWVRQHV